jgi:hypothetical protein
MRAVLDSGSYKFMIPKVLADYLHLTLRCCKHPYGTAGGPKKGHIAEVEHIEIGQECVAEFHDIEVAVIDANTPVLIGRDPFFKAYVVIIEENQRSVECIRSDLYRKRSD